MNGNLKVGCDACWRQWTQYISQLSDLTYPAVGNIAMVCIVHVCNQKL